MTGHVLGCLCVVVALMLATVAVVVAFGAAGAAGAAVVWLGVGVLLVDVEALRR